MTDLQKSISEREAYLAKIKQALVKFPGLTEIRDRWGTVRLSARSANEHVTDCEMGRTCGCCEDASLLVRPYLMFEGLTIYSDPITFLVGQSVGIFRSVGHVPTYFEKNMREAGIPQNIIDKAAEWVLAHAPKEEQMEDLNE